MNISFVRTIVAASFAIAPLSAFAQRSIEEIFGDITGFLNIIITFFILLATVLFLWGIVRYITAGGDETKTAEARNMIIWGIVFLAIMVAVWGFVNVLLEFVLETDSSTPTPIPEGPQQ